MEKVNDFINNIGEKISSQLPGVIGAILVFIVGKFLSNGVKKLVISGLNKWGLDDKIKSRTGSESKATAMIANLVYLILLTFTLLLTLDLLGVENVLDPFKNMIAQFTEMIPNIIAAAIICFAGYMLAEMCSAGTGIISKPLDKHTEKAGLSKDFSISQILAKLVKIIVFIPIAIAALDALKIEAISAPAQNMLQELLDAIPNILAAAIILAVAFIFGRFVTNLLSEFLKDLGADRLPEKLGMAKAFNEKFTFSSLIGSIAFFYIILAAAMSAVGKLGIASLESIVQNTMTFAAQITVGLVILGVGCLISNAIFGVAGEKRLTIQLARFAVNGLVLSMGLNAMGIADSIVNMAFGLTLGAIAVAFALAFGLGGREAAGKELAGFFERLKQDKPKD